MTPRTTQISSRFNDIKHRYDLLIVGGGIYGAALLREAARHGISAVLIERDDYAGGASANSLKIIHGGLRYLQRFDIPRIRSSAREQLCFLKTMPHLVEPLSCVSPCYGSGMKSRAAFQIAFWLYSILCFDIRNIIACDRHPLPNNRILPPGDLPQAFPALSALKANGTANWHDAIALDTERIVLTLIMEACERGAHAFNYTEMLSFITKGSRVLGIRAKDHRNNEEVSLYAEHVVTCTGEASTNMKNLDVPDSVFGQLRFAKAVNIIVARQIGDRALALQAGRSDGNGKATPRRLLFFVPWYKSTMIGTWYFPCGSQNDGHHLNEKELGQIISQVNAAYPEMALQPEDITYVHLGRLPALHGNLPSGEPRLLTKTRIINHSRSSGWDRLWSVIGVKYTTARATAVKVLQGIFQRRLGFDPLLDNAGTACGQGHASTWEAMSHKLKTSFKHNIQPGAYKRLFDCFGNRTAEVLQWIGKNESMLMPVPGTTTFPQAALCYSLHHEKPWHLTDLLLRRSNLGSAAPPALETTQWTADLIGRHFNWDEGRKRAEMDNLDKHYNWWNSADTDT